MTLSIKTDPFLWIHLAGIAIAPLTLQIVWIALGSSPPLTLYWLEFALIASVGILPILWMQWARPFCIYSLLILALKPEVLTPEQQKVLSLFKRKRQQILSVVIAILMFVILWLLYQWAPVTALVTPITPPSRLAAILIAAIAFLLSNLFIQVPLSVLAVMLTQSEQLAAATPVNSADIPKEFTLFGIRVKQILPIKSGF
ncbi:low-complexity tail membrane protein [Gloeocapsa sp. PCC 73106]|uniref:low-complexity tail membrane protein n=1 Tax=Gloeocapsa sp. PCC 73106 TaxID=102232 RepID=UPI0002ACD4D2|nr:low-complexity tail membrane protein [Gloeocapsa sp. PCC 73106]ELR98662.1 hypothetical protein GLO73106DRAFT_00025000 [Gloeocapsa sp. PCC 73106]